MSHFQGSRSYPYPVADLIGKLGDAAFLVGCLNEIEEIREATADRAVWKLRPKLSFLSGTLDVEMDIIERAEQSLKYRLISKAIGATSTVIAELRFTSMETGTRIDWKAELTERTGLLRMVPIGLISATANKVIEDTWQAIDRKLESLR